MGVGGNHGTRGKYGGLRRDKSWKEKKWKEKKRLQW